VPELGAQLLASRLELATHAAHAAGPGILAQRIDHRPADATLGKRLELDPAAPIEPLGRVDEPDHPVLDEVTEVNRVRHGGRHPTCEGFDEGQSGFDAVGCGAGFDSHSFAHPPDPGLGPDPHRGNLDAKIVQERGATGTNPDQDCKLLK